eukprot:CAMPEP_0204869086 /NCGR_PEP_ID=MMETSP1348-20121228/28535_1 /ASSEMBLY_ACC=CAM_ASM_000700 /TAXON_ID=215587 /ORGANISM="Aplanochytrium stocchinoi, Strain GSBS06" /LENGTH=400 /DNA_ID=CAMNT_0052022289 /DNA_START=625 /DNA_END=1824 /DNA_ORIENTATION=+
MTVNVRASSEPWLYPPTQMLAENVDGFVGFLRAKLEELSNENGSEKGNAEEIALRLRQLEAWRNHVGTLLQYCVEDMHVGNFIDHIELPMSSASCFEANVAEYNQSVQVAFNNGLNEGFMLAKNLRHIHRKYEEREVWLALKGERQKDGTMKNLGETVVLKRVGKVELSDMKQTNHNIQLLCREFKAQHLLGKLEHPNILPLLCVFENEHSIFSVSPLGGSSDLMEILSAFAVAYRAGFPEPVVRNLMRHAITGLIVAHNVGVAHRDVSLENMVVKDRENMLTTPLTIIDWGHCCGVHLRDGTSGKFASIPHEGPLGKAKYMAPELLSKSRTVYDPFAADVFALGVCVFSLLVGRMPFKVALDDHGQILSKSASELLALLGLSQKLSKDAVDLLNKLLAW